MENNNSNTTYYALGGKYELRIDSAGNQTSLSYLGNGVVKYDAPGYTNDKILYLLKDHLGSVVKVIAINGSSVNTIETFSFDVWGNRRNPSNWTYSGVAAPVYIFKGFTGHEHLDAFGLIHARGRVYDPVRGMFLSPDPYVQGANAQSFNRYLYCNGNPVMYVDEDGEYFFWIIPSIGWSRQGGFSIGLTAIVGMPGIISAQVGIGYSFKNNDFSVTIGATAAFNTVYTSYSTQSGFSVGWAAGLSPQMGFPISTNFLSVGVNYNITHNSWNGNLSAWSIDKNGITFNPSISLMLYPEHTTNLMRGKGFRSNSAVFDKMMSNDYTCQQILDYFGFEGTYVGGEGQSSFNLNQNAIRYRDDAFDSYAALISTYTKESYHASRYRKYGKNGLALADSDIFSCAVWPEERLGAIHQYKNQGLYTNDPSNWLNIILNTETFINLYNDIYNSPYNFSPYQSKWWHFIYKIPRKW